MSNHTLSARAAQARVLFRTSTGDFFINDVGRTYPASAETVGQRFGPLLLNRALARPNRWHSSSPVTMPADLLEAWRALNVGLSAIEYTGEILIEDFAVIYTLIQKLRRLGVTFADSFMARITELHREILGTPDDSDHDEADERLEPAEVFKPIAEPLPAVGRYL